MANAHPVAFANSDNTGRVAPLLALDHGGASVADLSRSIRFYREVLGFTLDEQFAIPGTLVTGAVLSNPGGARVELFWRQGSIAGPPGHPVDSILQQGWFQLAFCVADLSATFDSVVAAGVKVVKAPFTAPDGQSKVAFIADPDGHLIEFIQRRAT
jgi:catechol 2,3-dioxygenase-like lactoylglutathione lyase family enzyme